MSGVVGGFGYGNALGFVVPSSRGSGEGSGVRGGSGAMVVRRGVGDFGRGPMFPVGRVCVWYPMLWRTVGS